MATFADIKIVGMDDKGSTAVAGSALMDVHLILSERPPYDWASLFDQLWHTNLYMMKRHAQIVGNTIVISCVPAEIETHHLTELKKIVADTNKAYGQHVTKEEQKIAAVKALEEQQGRELSDVKSRLKFDD